MTKQNILKASVAALTVLALPMIANAGTPVKATKNVVEKTSESCISGDLGVDAFSQYVFHGITLENQGAILQPYANLYFKVQEGSGALTSTTVDLGIWNSFHSNHTVASSTRNWFEFDFLAGLTFNFGNLSVSPKYVYYSSPGDYFASAHVAQLRVGYNDSGLLGAWSLQPYVFVEYELENKSGNGPDDGGLYYELGVSPSTTLGPVAISFPVKLGLGSNDYYAGDDTYGFFSAGVSASYQLGFVPECLGTWSLSANATWYHFGDQNQPANGVKDADDDAFVFGGGLKVAF